MTHKQTYSRVFAAVITGVMAVPLWADESPSLLQIMQQLGRNLNQISNGLWQEDYGAITAAAQAIADHPQPPVAQRTQIITGLGADAGHFRQGDQVVHDAALAVKDAAEQGDGELVLQRYQELVAGCMDCHKSFRERVRALGKTE